MNLIVSVCIENAWMQAQITTEKFSVSHALWEFIVYFVYLMRPTVP